MGRDPRTRRCNAGARELDKSQVADFEGRQPGLRIRASNGQHFRSEDPPCLSRHKGYRLAGIYFRKLSGGLPKSSQGRSARDGRIGLRDQWGGTVILRSSISIDLFSDLSVSVTGIGGRGRSKSAGVREQHRRDHRAGRVLPRASVFFANDPARDRRTADQRRRRRAILRHVRRHRHRHRDQFAKFATCGTQTSRAKNLIDSW